MAAKTVNEWRESYRIPEKVVESLIVNDGLRFSERIYNLILLYWEGVDIHVDEICRVVGYIDDGGFPEPE